MNKLHVDSVTKNYGYNTILTNIYLSCKPGEIVGLMGRNGSGKSTLLKIIFGCLSAEYKHVRVGKKLIRNIFDRRNLINYLPQHSFLPNHLRIKTLIKLFCDKRNENLILANDLIEPHLHKFITQLSGGERRLLEILLLVHSKANFILLDEPFNGVAPLYKDVIKQYINDQAKENEKGFIITDHDYRNIIEIATRMVLLHDGRTIAVKDQQELIDYGYLSDFI